MIVFSCLTVLAAVDPIAVPRQMLMLPLCLSIAIVYKTMRCENLREVPLAALILRGTLVLGMYAVGVGLWALFWIMA